jgi:hypothetical protein
MRVFAMELFTKLFGDLLLFVYHCFDRIVIHGYLSGLSRPEQVVHFFRKVVGIPVLSKEILSQRTADYQNWVEAFARNHNIPIEWAEKGVRKEDYVLPWLRRMTKRNAYGVYFIFKSMEQGPSFRVSVPKYPTKDPNHRILARQRSRFTHDYFYIRDEVLGPMVMRVATFFPFQTTYYLNGHNFIEQELNRAQVGFRKNDNAFLAIDDVAALQAAADRLSPDIIRERLDYWTLILGPKFSVKERKRVKLSRFYAISQIEYCRNFIFKRNLPIHKLFERGCLDWLQYSLMLANQFVDAGGIRIVGCGTCFEYDWNYGVCREDFTPLAPTTLYGACKHALHVALEGLAKQAGISFGRGRFFSSTVLASIQVVSSQPSSARSSTTGQPKRRTAARSATIYISKTRQLGLCPSSSRMQRAPSTSRRGG